MTKIKYRPPPIPLSSLNKSGFDKFKLRKKKKNRKNEAESPTRKRLLSSTSMIISVNKAENSPKKEPSKSLSNSFNLLTQAFR